MRIGCCLPGGSFPAGKTTLVNVLTKGYRAVMDAGYDYAEASVGTLMSLSQDEIGELAAVCRRFFERDAKILSRHAGNILTICGRRMDKAVIRRPGLSCKL